MSLDCTVQLYLQEGIPNPENLGWLTKMIFRMQIKHVLKQFILNLGLVIATVMQNAILFIYVAS